MDAKVLYWTGALLNLAVLAALAGAGVVQIRKGNVAAHRRLMLTAAALVAAFLLSYALKLVLLGREDLSVWSAASVNTLRLHELCVLLMLVAGGIALHRARAMRSSRNVTRSPEDPVADPAIPLLHRRAGWAAVVAAVLGFASATFVLAGMYSRLPG